MGAMRPWWRTNMTKFRAPAKATVAEAAMTPITVTVTTAGSPEPATTDKARGRITATRPHKIPATAATNENRCRVNSGGENQMNRTVSDAGAWPSITALKPAPARGILLSWSAITDLQFREVMALFSHNQFDWENTWALDIGISYAGACGGRWRSSTCDRQF